MTDISKKILENIEYLIKIRGYEIGKVEQAIGVSTGYFSRTLKHDVNMPIDKVVKIAEFFKVPIDYLVYGSYKKQYLEDQIAKMQGELKEIQGGDDK